MRINFTIDPSALFYAVMDRTLLDKRGIESTQNGALLGDTFALSKDESDAFFLELDNCISILCQRVPQLEWEPNDGINMSVESASESGPHNIAMAVEKALQYMMLSWWYIARHANLASLAANNADSAILRLKRLLEPNMTKRTYRYF